MRKSNTLNLGTGAFVLLGFAALAFLTTQITSRGLHFGSTPHYDVTAKFDNIGDLKVGAPVSMAGVEVGRVARIDLDLKEYKAVVLMRVNSRYNQIPTDSDASIYTQGLLGGKFHRLDRGRRRHLSQGQERDRFHPVRVRAREFDRPVAGEFRQGREFIELIGVFGLRAAQERGPRPHGETQMKLTRFRRFETISVFGACLFLGTAGLADRQALADPQAQPAGAPAAAPNTLGPEQLVEDSAKRMLTELDANRAMYTKDPSKLDGLVANVLLPNFDSEYAARLVLGQSWRTATPDQRKRFVDAFYHSLLRNYGNALLNFTANNFTILPYKGDPGDTQATVRTEVKKATGEKVAVNFSLHKTDSGWKAWDVVIEGISYVKSFRTDFGSEIQQKGLDEVISRLEKEGTVRANGVSPPN